MKHKIVRCEFLIGFATLYTFAKAQFAIDGQGIKMVFANIDTFFIKDDVGIKAFVETIEIAIRKLLNLFRSKRNKFHLSAIVDEGNRMAYRVDEALNVVIQFLHNSLGNLPERIDIF